MFVHFAIRFIGLFALCALPILASASLAGAEPPTPPLRTGQAFRDELEQPFSTSWTKSELRQMLLQVSRARGIAIVLDRRLDPSTEQAVTFSQAPLLDGLNRFADLAQGRISLPDNFVYLGPAASARQLRTLMALRSRELSTRIPEPRRAELQTHRTVHWNDLDSPREILDRLTGSRRLTITNPDLITHDLWAAATLPDVTITEALSVVLIQFDLTFRWLQAGTSIEFVPLPEPVRLERKYRPKQKLAEALSAIHEKCPEAEASIVGSEIFVHGTVEDLEAIDLLLHTKTTKPPGPKRTPQTLRDQLLTLKVNAPVSNLMKSLTDSGVRFEYDADQLKAAGVDFDHNIVLDVENEPMLNVLKSIFEPLALDFQIDQMTVKLKPKGLKDNPK